MNSNDSTTKLLFDEPGPKGKRLIRIMNWIAGAVLIALAVVILARLANPPQGENQLSWDLWKPALDTEAWTDFYLPGLGLTLGAAAAGIVGSLVFGLVFGVLRLLPNPYIRFVAAIIIEFCRAVPVLIMMVFFWRWFAAVGIRQASYFAVVLALILYNGSVIAELVRSGVGNLPGGQREASLALGLTRTESLMQVEVPQAIFAMLPATVTQLVVALKDTALGSIILYTDLLQESRRLGSMYFNILQTLAVSAVVYFVICWIVSRIAEAMPAWMANRTSGPVEEEVVPPIAVMDATNRNQIKAAKTPRPFGGAEPVYPDHYHGSNAHNEHWLHNHYVEQENLEHPHDYAQEITQEIKKNMEHLRLPQRKEKKK
ncbi:amino acid ABC transporter permease [Alloscardovia macacae]|uniref:ABC transporter permease n=1 Tax=Alloscardovia macacae TaxID=1160091 RepID=A0A1Y2SSX2_9BIFI|nr:amino acid ABC transporter permease [Alloscardovia macacae]OTA25900.1 ABC transporter permease [Alloscardovia macacae]OTA28281.1 ABC transporter permease [Alloscardovia macacae]OZG53151.1 ABC transporter permease [Alloscardovia macacae]